MYTSRHSVSVLLRRALLLHWGEVGTPLTQLRTLPTIRRKHTASNGCRKYSLNLSTLGSSDLLEFSEAATEDVRHFRVVPDFLSPAEEQSVLKEASRALRGRKYQYDHWDGAIEGYKETEKTQWSADNQPLIERLRGETSGAVGGREPLQTLEEVHVLDLAPDGVIKPHVDSVKFCGEVIAGISLISSSVMKLQHQEDPKKWIHALLPKRSLYIMSGVVRFCYTHAIPSVEEESVFRGEKIVRERRLSIICRTKPTA